MRSWARSHRLIRFLAGAGVTLWLLCGGTALSAAGTVDDLAFLTSILRNDDIPITTRTDAAVRLLRLGGEGPDNVLSESLRSGDPKQVEAVARALAANGAPQPAVADALVEALASAQPELGALAGRSLARLGDRQVLAILALLSREDVQPESRLAAIGALSAFQSRAAVEGLIQLLKTRQSSAERSATTRALREITLIDLGEDPQAWRAWWSAVGEMPLDQAIGMATADRERQLQEQQEAINTLEKKQTTLGARLQSVLGKWFITLSEEQREPELRGMLADEIVFVRIFAGNQVQRMLRNGVTPEEQTITSITHLLDDERSDLRVLGAQLLAAMRVDGLPERLAREVAEEIDSEVAAAMLDQIAMRPSPAAFEPTLIRLNDPVAGMAAARAMARLVDEGMVPEDWADRSLQGIRALHANEVSPATASLLVLAGKDEDLERARADLNNDAAAVRRASAFAFVQRGIYEPVIEQASDVGVRPAAIEALVLLPPSLSSVQKLLEIELPDSELATWRDAVRRLSLRFPLSRQLEVDKLLATDERVPVNLRASVLEAAMSSAEGGQADEGVRRSMLDRYTLLLVKENRWQDVATALGSPDLQLDDALNERLFISRMRLEDFEGAAAIESRPEVWIDFVNDSVQTAPAGAAAIVAEIRTRFADRLDDTQRERLDAISRQIAVVDGSLAEPEGG